MQHFHILYNIAYNILLVILRLMQPFISAISDLIDQKYVYSIIYLSIEQSIQ